MDARVEIYDNNGVIVTLPTNQSFAGALACMTGWKPQAWRYIVSTTGEISYGCFPHVA